LDLVHFGLKNKEELDKNPLIHYYISKFEKHILGLPDLIELEA
jgi:hypothetical protein